MSSRDLVWDDFTVTFDLASLKQKCRIRPNSRQEAVLTELVVEAAPLARPKAVIRSLSAELLGENRTRLGDFELESPVLYKHLSAQTGPLQSFFYVATCGLELDEWSKPLNGIREYLAAEIMIQALRMAVAQSEQRLCESHGFKVLSAMNPGSLPREWPITGQRDLFRVMGDLPGQIGVKLLPSLLMTPAKSGSGLWFPTEEKVHNCRLCPNLDCPERREP